MVDTANGQVSGGVTLTEGVDLLARVANLSGVREGAVRELVSALAELNRAGVVESLEGLPIDVWLATQHGWTAAERAMLLDAGDVLASMPATLEWWRRGILSWSVVRDIVAKVRRLGRDGRTAVDGRLAASGGLLADMDPDQVGWAVDDAVDAVRGATAKEREEEQAEKEAFLALQRDLFGGSWVSGYLDPIATAITTGGLDRRAAADVAGQGSRGSVAKDRARALTGLCADELGADLDDFDLDLDLDEDDDLDEAGLDDDDAGLDDDEDTDAGAPGAGGSGPGPAGSGGPGAAGGSGPPGRQRRRRGRPAKPLFIVHVLLGDRLTGTAAGLLEVGVPGLLPRLSARLLDNLARDADIRAVIFDGARPLHVTAKTHATDVPDDTRLAVLARDLGARDPAGRTTAPGSQVHHLTPGLHDPDRLVTISRRGHTRIVHRHGWSGEVDPDDATVTWTRNGKTIRTVPWGTPLNHPADPTDPDAPEPVTGGPEPERPAR